MQQALEWYWQDTTLYLKGVLDHTTVVPLYPAGAAWLNTAPKAAAIDLSQVVQSNSAGIALLLHWLRIAQKNQLNVAFKALPAQMVRLISVHGVQALFSVYLNEK